MKGTDRSRVFDPWSSLRALLAPGVAERREYPAERPRAVGGFLKPRSSGDSHSSDDSHDSDDRNPT